MRSSRSRALWRAGTAAGTITLLLAGPAVVLGHSLSGTYESRLPLLVYLVGAGVTVALSFAFVLLRDLRAEPPAAHASATLPPAAVRIGLRVIGLLAWAWIVVQGLVGRSSAADVGSLFVWVYTWVAIALVSALVFPIWHWLDPFSTLHDIGAAVLRRLGVARWETVEYPRWLGRWPAVIGFAFVVWMEIILDVPGGSTLFVAVAGYTAFTLAMMAQFGRDEWRANGETFSVWFRLLNRLAPRALADEAGRLRPRTFGAGLLEPGWTQADVVLVAFATGSILFDGLSQTAAWFDVFGSPAAPALTVQLLGFLVLIAAAALGVAAMVGLPSTGAGLLPIAVGYLAAHYLTYLLIEGQRIVIALSDPLQLGWNLFGTAFHQPSGEWLEPGFVWTIQLVAVVGGHMLGAWGGHVAAAREAGQDIRLRQVPLAVVMVALTTITLWSLGQAVVVSPDEAAGIVGIPTA